MNFELCCRQYHFLWLCMLCLYCVIRRSPARRATLHRSGLRDLGVREAVSGGVLCHRVSEGVFGHYTAAVAVILLKNGYVRGLSIVSTLYSFQPNIFHRRYKTCVSGIPLTYYSVVQPATTCSQSVAAYTLFILISALLI